MKIFERINLIFKKAQFALIFLAILLSACGPQVSPTQAPLATQQPSETPAVAATATFEPVDIKVGIFNLASYAPLYFAQAEGFYAEQRLSVKLLPFTTGTDLLVALIQGDIDVMGYAVDLSTFKAVAEGTGVRVVADKGFYDSDSCASAGWMARNEVLDSGQLDDLSNVPNLILQSSQAVAFYNYTLDVLLEPVDLSSDDLEVVDIPLANRLDALQNGAIDIASLGEPWITRVSNAGVARLWMGYNDLIPDSQAGILAFGPTLTQENREAGNRFMIAYLKGVRLHNEGKTDRNVELMSEFTQLDPEEVRQMCWQAFTSDGSVNAENMIDFQEWALKKGLIDAVVPLEEFWDGSFLEFANQALEE